MSDRTYTRWVRRLPWLYIAPIPLALAWVLMWSPPFTGVPTYWEIVALAVGIVLGAGPLRGVADCQPGFH